MNAQSDRPEGKTLGQRVKERRQALGLSQERLARLADVSRSTVFNLEAGRIEKPYALRAIARALEVDVATLTGEQAAPEADVARDGDDPLLQQVRDLAERARLLEEELLRRQQEGRERRERGA